MSLRAFIFLTALALAACFQGGGTEDTNDLKVSGRVLDRNEKPVPGAKAVLNPRAADSGGPASAGARPESTLTDRGGYYAFPHVAPGLYELRLYARNAAGSEREVARLDVDLTAGRDLELAPVSAALALHWKHRAGLVLDATWNGGVATDFPLLVRLSGSAFPVEARVAGEDIRFAGTDGIPLSYEIERWDSNARQAEIWVRMDTVRSDTATALWMFWGNADAEDGSHGASVFDSAEGYAGVWHLHGDSGSASPGMPDASAARNPGTFQGTAPVATGAAAIGKGVACDGVDQYLATSNLHFDPDAFTLSLWFRTTVAGGKLAGFESSRLGNGTYFDRQIWLDDEGHLRFGVFPPAPAAITAADSPFVRLGVVLPGENPDMPDIERILVTPAAYADGSWHQVTAVLSPAGQFLYVDGALAASDPGTVNAAAFPGYWRFGGGGLGNWVGRSDNEFYRGMIDEASVAMRARSAEWIRLAFLTQAPGSASLKFRSEY